MGKPKKSDTNPKIKIRKRWRINPRTKVQQDLRRYRRTRAKKNARKIIENSFQEIT